MTKYCIRRATHYRRSCALLARLGQAPHLNSVREADSRLLGERDGDSSDRAIIRDTKVSSQLATTSGFVSEIRRYEDYIALR